MGSAPAHSPGDSRYRWRHSEARRQIPPAPPQGGCPRTPEAFVDDALADIVINADTVGTASDINTVINTADADIDTNNARFP